MPPAPWRPEAAEEAGATAADARIGAVSFAARCSATVAARRQQPPWTATLLATSAGHLGTDGSVCGRLRLRLTGACRRRRRPPTRSAPWMRRASHGVGRRRGGAPAADPPTQRGGLRAAASPLALPAALYEVVPGRNLARSATQLRHLGHLVGRSTSDPHGHDGHRGQRRRRHQPAPAGEPRREAAARAPSLPPPLLPRPPLGHRPHERRHHRLAPRARMHVRLDQRAARCRRASRSAYIASSSASGHAASPRRARQRAAPTPRAGRRADRARGGVGRLTASSFL